VLGSLQRAVGDLDRVAAWVTVDGLVNAEPGYAMTTVVINPVSDLLLEVFGDAGRHARTTTGVAALPMSFPVVVEAEAVLRRRPVQPVPWMSTPSSPRSDPGSRCDVRCRRVRWVSPPPACTMRPGARLSWVHRFLRCRGRTTAKNATTPATPTAPSAMVLASDFGKSAQSPRARPAPMIAT
jgi:hypothetical protein